MSTATTMSSDRSSTDYQTGWVAVCHTNHHHVPPEQFQECVDVDQDIMESWYKLYPNILKWLLDLGRQVPLCFSCNQYTTAVLCVCVLQPCPSRRADPSVRESHSWLSRR